MEHDCFAILGLTPGPYSRELIDARFDEERDKCLASIRERHDEATERRLEAVYLAYHLLNDSARQQRHIAAIRDGHLDNPKDHVRDLVAASLEDGLLRYSRRQELIRIGRVLGLNEFQVHLLIAEVQVAALSITAEQPAKQVANERFDQTRLNIVAAGLLGLGLFFSAISWLGI